MTKPLKWAILGTGSIAKKFAEGLPVYNLGSLVAVGSRELHTAEKFCEEFLGKPYGSYQDAIDDPDVEAVYISLPHHLHADWTIRCAQAGKHILCEKPFTLTAASAQRALEAVQQAGVFFMEAFMYRFHPNTIALRQLLKDGVIGTPRFVHAEFGFATQRPGVHFRIDGPLGGGALMDVGCYCTNFIRMVAGAEPHGGVYRAELGETSYDKYGTGMMDFESGLRATFACSIHVKLQNHATVQGDNGWITLTDPWFGNGQVIVGVNGREPEPFRTQPIPQIWGNQSVVVAQMVEAGKTETGLLTWGETVGNVRLLEAFRKSAGMAEIHDAFSNANS